MTTLRQASARLVSFFRKQALDREFNEELAAHIAFLQRLQAGKAEKGDDDQATQH